VNSTTGIFNLSQLATVKNKVILASSQDIKISYQLQQNLSVNFCQVNSAAEQFRFGAPANWYRTWNFSQNWVAKETSIFYMSTCNTPERKFSGASNQDFKFLFLLERNY